MRLVPAGHFRRSLHRLRFSAHNFFLCLLPRLACKRKRANIGMKRASKIVCLYPELRVMAIGAKSAPGEWRGRSISLIIGLACTMLIAPAQAAECQRVAFDKWLEGV